MTALERIQRYLRALEWRLRLFAASRGLAVIAGSALLMTLLFAYIGNRFEFAPGVVLPLRVLLYAAVATGLAFALVRPLARLNRRRVTQTIEGGAPEFRERLLTLSERGHEAGPWMELLAEETLDIARAHAPSQIRSQRLLLAFGVTAAAGLAVLVWLVAAGPGYIGYGASLLWTGHADSNKRPLYAIEVQPGDKTIRRRSSQAVTAHLIGFSTHDVVLHARYGNSARWDTALMEPVKGSDAFRFLLAGVNEPVEYYVEASHSRSHRFTINVRDLPGVKRMRVALHYPAELALQDVVLEPAGDIRAVVGTRAEIHVETDRYLDRGVLALDKGKEVELHHEEGNWLSATLPVERDGVYHVAAIDSAQTIRISDDYFVEAKKDEAPVVKISRPGNDPHVSPIEELPVTVTASDDFGVGALELHYAVNGGPERTLQLMKAGNVKEAEGRATIAFEDLKAAPGDLLSMYAVARDAHTTSRSDLVFAQADAFDYRYSQSQQEGGNMGGGGGGNEASDMSQRQKQLIAATFNQLKAGKTGAQKAEDAKFLSGEQNKLSDQAKTLAERMASREMGSSGSQFEQFAKLMRDASADMAGAANQLKPAKWNDALPPEQKALTSLLRADALFRDIQISMSRQGGGGGSGSAGRDLARMLDLELDTSKNQYETGQSNGGAESADRQKAIDEARRRLEALARRQQELAAQNLKQQSVAEQRWQEEQLRREAEELRRQLQEMAQNSKTNGQGQQAQQGQDGKQQTGQGQQGQPGEEAQAKAGQQSQGQQGQRGEQGQQGQGAQQGQQTAQSGSSSQNPSQRGGQQAGQQQFGSQQAAGQQSGTQRAGSRQYGQYGAQQYGSQNGNVPSAAQTDEALRQATRAIERAEEEMRKSVTNHDGTAGARAGEQLNQAQQLMAQALQKQAGGTVSDLASRAEQIAGAQRQLADKMKRMYGMTSDELNRERDRMRLYAGYRNQTGSTDPNAMPEMNDPTARRRRYGYSYGGMYPPTPTRPASAEEKAIADEKEKLAGAIEGLQRQVHEQAQGISGARPDASAKLLRALSEAESKELALRMQKNAEWIRQGFGDRNLDMEDNVTGGLQDLSKALRDIQLSLNAPDPAGEGRQTARDQAAGTRTPGREDSPAGYRDAVAGYFKKLSQNQASTTEKH